MLAWTNDWRTLVNALPSCTRVGASASYHLIRSMPGWRRLSREGRRNIVFFLSDLFEGWLTFMRTAAEKRCFLFEILISRGGWSDIGMIQGGTKSGRKFEIQFLSIILVDKFSCRLIFPPFSILLFITFFVFLIIKIFETYIYIDP